MKSPKKPSKISRLLKYVWRSIILLLFLSISSTIGACLALLILSTQLPDVALLENYSPPQALEIYSSGSKLLTRISSRGRYDPVELKNVPKHVQEAVISAEDKRFRTHPGIDPLGLARAILTNITDLSKVKATSTLTQQLVKNLYLTPERTPRRKLSEMILALQITRRYSKEKILEIYLNHVFLGHNVYGIEAAAQIYFGKPAKSLTLGEAAMIAGIIRSPELYSPHHNMKAAKKLQDIVLGQMERNETISPEERKQALKEPLKLISLRKSYPQPYFLDYVLHTIRSEYGDAPFRQGGWKVYTTLDLKAQKYAEKLLKDKEPWLKKYNAEQAALISLDPQTGYIKVLVGGTDYKKSQFNRAFQAKRQVGSTFKPLVYLTAFQQGMYLRDTLEDEPVSYGSWRPRNWDHRFRGEVNLEEALSWSINVPTVKLAQKVGMEKVIYNAKLVGIDSPIPVDLTSALGASEMSLVEVTSAYGVFASEGLYAKPTPIIKIVDEKGYTLMRNFPEPARVLEAEPIYLLNKALQSVISRGTGYAARIGRPVGGKTGTTSKNHDAWFVGFTPQLVTGVWVGNDTPSPTKGGGGTLAAPIWQNYMNYATKNMPIKSFTEPPEPPEEEPLIKELDPEELEKLMASTPPGNLTLPSPSGSTPAIIESSPEPLVTSSPPASPEPTMISTPVPTIEPTPLPTAIQSSIPSAPPPTPVETKREENALSEAEKLTDELLIPTPMTTPFNTQESDFKAESDVVEIGP